jgi:two-component system NtrC family response regulator
LPVAKILLIDDDANLREVLAFTLREQGHDVETAAAGTVAVSRLGELRPDVVITDLRMPGIDGLEVLHRVREFDPNVPVILLTAFGTIEEAVEAMRAGAHSYLTKPYDREELKVTVDQALERRRLLEENRSLRDSLRRERRQVELVHASPVMERIVATVRRIAPTDATVLLTGESGTGKEVVAEALHAQSGRWDREFVAVNCAAIPHDLMESVLFGHARGAFTGAVRDAPGLFRRADRGTIFLDEIADLPLELQTKMLRVIETGQVDPVGGPHPVEVDVRLIVATNADLSVRVAEGRFRSDLFYRINVIPIHLPPLRQRPEDIPALWEHFLARFGGTGMRSTPALIRALLRRPWPGNVRELANLCRRMVLLRDSDTLREEDLPGEDHEPAESTASATPAIGVADRALPAAGPGGHAATPSKGIFPGELPPDRLSLPELEREVIERALHLHGGNRTRAARYLGIPRHVLIYRIEKFGIRLK